jgi:hypothetical protein
MLASPFPAPAQTIGPQFYQSRRWRCIGPFRAGRTVGAAGVPSQPNLFYIGVNNGGVWKTTDARRNVKISDSITLWKFHGVYYCFFVAIFWLLNGGVFPNVTPFSFYPEAERSV